jgi:hypothetical protein
VPASITLAQGPAAAAGYWYAIGLSGFLPNSGVVTTCFDSASPSGFKSFTLATDATGHAATAAYCFSGDGPDHWVSAGGVQSNHVQWSAPATPTPIGCWDGSTVIPPATCPPVPPLPVPTITASRGGQYGCGNCYALNVQVHNFPTGTFAYYCHDNSGPGGSDLMFFSHAVAITDPNQAAWSGVFCDDNAPYSAYVVINNVTSNRVQY